jgi:uncharacterized protein (TIGR02391 family)
MSALAVLETVVRKAHRFTEPRSPAETQHPFEIRDIHPALPGVVRKLFDNAHYSQATFEACKFLDNEVRRHANVEKTGKALMMDALKETLPPIRLNALTTETDRNEQEGYKFLFAGTMIAIRNPRGHQHALRDDVGTCLDHLSLVSHLLRRMEQAGYRPTTA